MLDTDEPRTFQFWEYSVSHGCLLVRSPSSPNSGESVDFAFYGVEFVQMARHLGTVSLDSPTAAEVGFVESQIGKKLAGTVKLWALSDGRRRHLVAASAVHTSRNKSDIFESPFKP